MTKTRQEQQQTQLYKNVAGAGANMQGRIWSYATVDHPTYWLTSKLC